MHTDRYRTKNTRAPRAPRAPRRRSKCGAEALGPVSGELGELGLQECRRCLAPSPDAGVVPEVLDSEARRTVKCSTATKASRRPRYAGELKLEDCSAVIKDTPPGSQDMHKPELETGGSFSAGDYAAFKDELFHRVGPM